MRHKPERTCIGCRGVFSKDDVIRIVAASGVAVLDYREKLSGRAAYVCPKRECIEKAFRRENMSRALKLNVKLPCPEEFIKQLAENIAGKIQSLILMSAKAGKLAAGYSAVRDAFEKGRVQMVLFASDLAEGTKEKLDLERKAGVREAILLTRDELGKILNRELIGVISFEDKGLADAIWKETERLKSLINDDE